MKRATCCWKLENEWDKDFNPRPREEGDKTEDEEKDKSEISIHALVKRATVTRFFKSEYFENFNPRPREEGDESINVPSNLRLYFNPRPREEGDQFFTIFCPYLCHFNPRPREEGDQVSICIVALCAISIHALVKRATLGLHACFHVARFQSTPS